MPKRSWQDVIVWVFNRPERWIALVFVVVVVGLVVYLVSPSVCNILEALKNL